MVKVSMGNQFVAVNQVTSYSFMDIFSQKNAQKTNFWWIFNPQIGGFVSINFFSCPDEGGRHPTNLMAYEIIPTNNGVGWRHPQYMDVSKNRGGPQKMDGWFIMENPTRNG